MDWPVFWSAASSVAAVGVLLITGVYAWLTHRLAKAAEQQIWEGSRARVVVSIGTNQGGQLFLLEFENAGNAPAENLTVVISRSVHQQLGNNKALTEAPFFSRGVRAFPPRKTVKFALGVSFRWLNDKTDRSLHPTSFDVTVRYQTLGRKIEETFAIDIEGQFTLSAVDKDYIDEFGRNFPDKFDRSMREISRTLGKISAPKPEFPQKRSWSSWYSRKVWKDHRWD